MWFIGWLLKIPSLLKGFAEFIARTWKLWAVVILLGTVFFAGRWYEERGWLEKEVGELEALRDARDERERILRQEHTLQLMRDGMIRVSLTRDLEALRQRESQLRDELEFAELELVRPFTIIGTINECKKLANPFGSDFIRLFNEYGRLGATRADQPSDTE